MEYLLALIITVLYAAGVYLILRRSIVKLILGLAFLGHASNLLIFTLGKVVRGVPPLLSEETHSIADGIAVADPVPQALILTAIVIGFGAQAFAIALIRKVYELIGTDDLDTIKEEED